MSVPPHAAPSLRPLPARKSPKQSLWLCVVPLCLAAVPAHADATDILIGASLPLSGPNAASGNEGLTVAKAALDVINAQGGVGGRKIQLVAMDDEFNPARAAANAKALADKGVVALFNCWGTASCSAIMPLVNEVKIPLVTGIAGGGPMRSAPGRYAFNFRPTTEQELTRMVTQMQTIGQTRVAVVYQNDAFGKSGLEAAQSVLGKAKLQPITEQAIERDGSNAIAVAHAIRTSNANGVILVASPQATVAAISTARKEGLVTQFYNLAAQANQKVVSDLGAYTAGVVFTTLVPNPWRNALPVVRDYQTAVQKATGKTDYSYLGLEVYLNTRILVDGLLKAGPKVTRESLVNALESMGERDFGNQVSVRFSASNHQGSGYVGLTIISRDGRFVE